jgi:hypothetical protein
VRVLLHRQAERAVDKEHRRAAEGRDFGAADCAGLNTYFVIRHISTYCAKGVEVGDDRKIMRIGGILSEICRFNRILQQKKLLENFESCIKK